MLEGVVVLLLLGDRGWGREGIIGHGTCIFRTKLGAAWEQQSPMLYLCPAEALPHSRCSVSA